MEETARRSWYWDNIKGILIILTVFAHVLYQLQDNFSAIDNTVDYIYMFHMPAFVFVSGYFGKSGRSQGACGISRLIFLYFIFNSAMGFLFGFGPLLEPMYSYWYLAALIVWRLTARHLAKFRRIELILLVIAVFAGFFPSINNSFAAARIIAFYPYYMLGYKLSAEKSGELVSEVYGRRLIKGAAALAAGGVIAFLAHSFFRYSDDALLMYGYTGPFGSFGRIALFIVAFLAICALRCLCPDRKIPLLSMFGRNSLWIFLMHRPFTIWLSCLTDGQSLGVILIAAALSTFVICGAFGNDIAAKYLNRFADSGAAILTGEDRKGFSVAKLAAILVAAGFVILVVIDAYSV